MAKSSPSAAHVRYGQQNLVTIEILYFEGCPNHPPTVDRVREILERLGLDAEVVEVEVQRLEDAPRLRFLGSPSVRVNGVDVEPAARTRTDYGFACRTYPEGAGMPSERMIEEAVLSLAPASAKRRLENLANEPCCPDEGEMAEARASERLKSAGVYTVVASFGAATLASACCWLPLLLIGFGVSAGGLAAFFESTRPLFLGVMAAVLTLGFYTAYLREEKCEPGSECETANRRLKRFNRGSLWIATVGAAVFAAFPYYVDRLPLGEAEAATPAQALQVAEVLVVGIEGMTCSGCAVTVEQTLRQTPGVLSAKVFFEDARAELRLDPSAPATRDVLSEVLRNSGFSIAAAAGQTPDH